MHVVVTGASSGIGKAIAETYAAKGADLTLVARREDLLLEIEKDLVEKYDVKVHVVVKDLSVPETAADFLEDAEEKLGVVDVLINNAGIQIVEAAHVVDPDAQDRMLNVDLLTPMRLCRAVLPAMVSRGHGSLVNVASVAGLAPVAGMTGYNAAKAGLGAYSESLAGEVAMHGVHVVTVYPGPVHTDLGASGAARYESSLAFRMQAWGTVDVLAKKILRAVEKKNTRVVYPKSYGSVRFLPDGMVRFAMDLLTPSLKSSEDSK
ncbi:MAG: SDR family NAD(P)-dependent oxidoreductase [Deltaproteobacteria bacterium]|nr:SDR family NAD(P)-dependent oxidoreductase [Deltaproteobacteria bacterium]